MKVEYSSNNSGGDWWLKDKHWAALEKAGWEVEWGGMYFCHSKYPSLMSRKPADLKECPEGTSCPGHRAFSSFKEARAADARWLGSLARAATREGLALADAIREWERVTGQVATALGCSCCGPPHSFTFYGDDGERNYWSPDYPEYGEASYE